MKMNSVLAFSVCLFLIFTVQAGAGTVFSDDFNDGNLDGWTTEGNVAPMDQAAFLYDTDGYSLLYQGIPLGTGRYVLEFDVSSELFAGGSFPDTFFASLYFINDLSQFDLTNLVFDDVVPQFDLDGLGFFNEVADLGPSAIGSGWTHVTYAFENIYNFAIPTFELLDLNGYPGDAAVGIDNVTIAVVPVPSTMTLLGIGLATLAARKRRMRAVQM